MGLLDSIRANGVINPLVVNREFVLVAGERRLEASPAARVGSTYQCASSRT